MQARRDCRKLFLNALSTLRIQFVRSMAPGTALLAVVVILFVAFLITYATHAPATHITHSVTKLIAGDGPGNGPVVLP